MEKDSDLLNKKKTVQISVTDKDGKEHPIDVETEMVPVGHEINYTNRKMSGRSKDPVNRKSICANSRTLCPALSGTSSSYEVWPTFDRK